jgi:uncharacterized phage protein gp47/JayE
LPDLVKSYEEITESILRQLTKAVVGERHAYQRDQTKVVLGSGKEKVRDIVRVEGLVGGERFTFAKNRDFRLAENMLEWVEGGSSPDELSSFEVFYSFGDPSPITDVNPGSVTRTIVESISREIQYLYEQLDYVYNSGFLDTATGDSLELVVALLGVHRRQAQAAEGVVTFGRATPPQEGKTDEETISHDGSTKYRLREAPVKDVVRVNGTLLGSSAIFAKNVDYKLEGDSIVWLPGGRLPDRFTEFTVRYQTYQGMTVPLGTVISTFARRSGEAKTFETTAERTLERNERGMWEAEVPVRALDPGPAGNVLAGTITIMPQPVEGIEYVTNRTPLTGGSDPENDDELRERAKGELRALGKATYTSLKQQVESVPGVVRPIKIQELPMVYTVGQNGESVRIPVAGVVRAIVDGGDLESIRRVVDETRAAGVYVEIVRPRLVVLEVKLLLDLERGKDTHEVEASARSAIERYIDSLRIGEPIIFSKLLTAVLSVEGVRDVGSMTVTADRGNQQRTESTRENITLGEDEKARLKGVTATRVP